MHCLFCSKEEKGNLDPEKDLICSLCVTTLLQYSQEELVKGYLLALKLGYQNKANALKSFIEKETLNESKNNRLPNGSRGNRVSGSGKKGSTNKLKAKGKNALRKGNKPVKNVFRSRPVKLVES